MRIGIITCHDVYNYGASLQAYALQTFLKIQGHEVKIIDYKPDYLSFHYRLSKYIPKSVRKSIPSLENPVIRMAYCLYRYLLSLRTYKRRRNFDDFTSNYLSRTKRYGEYESLKNDPPIFDIYIAGSDQIWNSAIMENGKDPAFYLTFTNSTAHKISYAASFGSTSISDDFKDQIREWLSKLDSISVREDSGVEIVEQLGLKASYVCDPVFLLNKDEWNNLIVTDNSDRYLLLYTIGDIPEYILSNAKIIADQQRLKLYSLSQSKDPRIDKNFEFAGPKEFVSLINHAEFIVTNSFHATAFSIIFNIQFVTYKYHSISNSSRMISILKKLGLYDRFEVTDFTTLAEINYSSCNTQLSRMISCSKNWLQDNIRCHI